MGHVEFSVSPTATGVREARLRVAELEGALSDLMLDDLRLLVSELVSNSIRHGELSPGDRIEVCLDWDTSRVRVEVTDAGRGFHPPPRVDHQSRESGWGLFIVDRIASRWGSDSGDHTCVWFEVDR